MLKGKLLRVFVVFNYFSMVKVIQDTRDIYNITEIN